MSILGNPADIGETFIDECARQMKSAVEEIISRAKLAPGSLLVIGCSTSEVAGNHIGSRAYPMLGQALAAAAMDACASRGVCIAAQCCEHLNRALVVEFDSIKQINLEQVMAVPTAKAGGSFAAAVYESMNCAALVESIRADAGIDVGGTLIGMHLKRVAVPVRLTASAIGFANNIAAMTRPAYTGGPRAEYVVYSRLT